jgi:putative hydrolase of the HAD superfamily
VLREDTVPFLDALKASGKRRILLTNAHPHNLAVKLEHTGLASHLDLLLSTHTFGYPKEDQRLWHAVAEETGLQPEERCSLTTASRFWIPRQVWHSLLPGRHQS